MHLSILSKLEGMDCDCAMNVIVFDSQLPSLPPTKSSPSTKPNRNEYADGKRVHRRVQNRNLLLYSKYVT